MPKEVIEGAGLLCGLVIDTDAPDDPPVRRFPLDLQAHQRVLDLIEAGAKQEAALAAEERAREVNDELEAVLRPYLKNEIAAEMDSGGSPEQRRKDFSRLRATCEKWNLPLNLPHEPAPWAGVAALLIEESQRGIEAATRLKNSISFSHRSLNLPDPTSDHFINAILRSIRNWKDPAPAEATVAD
jgi:hypothetical protein